MAEGLELCRRLLAAGAAGAVLTLGAAGAVAVLDGAEWRVSTQAVTRGEPRRLRRLLRRRPDAGAAARGRAWPPRCASPPRAGAANAASPYNGDVDPALAEELAGGASPARRR